MSTDERTVQARVKDDDVLAALEAAEEDSSMAEVVRSALRTHLVDDGESEDMEGLSRLARKGLRALRRNVDGDRAMVEVGTAESQIANECNIPKETVRPSVLDPLRRHGKIRLKGSVEHVFIKIGTEEAPERYRIRDPLQVGAGPTNYEPDTDADAEEVTAGD